MISANSLSRNGRSNCYAVVRGTSARASLSSSEIMMILIAFHQRGYRNFKTFYPHGLIAYAIN